MSLPRYPEYRNSGVAWLGEVPGHWDVKRLKYTADVRLSNIDKHTVEDEPPVLLCNYVDVYKNERINSGIEFMAATASHEQIRRLTLDVGDVIITKDSEDPRDIGVPALVSEVAPNLVCGYHLALLRPRTHGIGGYLYYLFKSRYVAAAFETEATGMTRYALGKYSIENLSIPLPSVEEQQTIAAFLDRETGKIDALIAEQQRLVELLAEKRQAVISHAVTKGLNPNARMKDSGIEWLGEVPEHWVVTRLGRICAEINDINHVMPDAVESGVPFLSAKDLLDDGTLNFTTNIKMISEEDFAKLSQKICPRRGDIIYSRIGACLGKARLVDTDIRFLVSYSCCVVRVIESKSSRRFIQHLLDGEMILTEARMRTQGIGVPDLGLGEIGRFPVPLPPRQEQEDIADYLDEQSKGFGALTAEANRAIELLQERRSALISAAVTGKIKVTDIQ